MRTLSLKGRAANGFTTIELLLTVTILCILLAIVSASYETIKAHLRFSQVKGDMDGIAQAAFNDYTSHDNVWAGNVLPGIPPSFVNNNDLAKWPKPPCPGWMYTWDNWSAFPINLTRVTVRRADLTALYSYCVQSLGNNCLAPDIFGGVPENLSSLSSPYFYCNE